jgi:hypothetical protein
VDAGAIGEPDLLVLAQDQRRRGTVEDRAPLGLGESRVERQERDPASPELLDDLDPPWARQQVDRDELTGGRADRHVR